MQSKVTAIVSLVIACCGCCVSPWISEKEIQASDASPERLQGLLGPPFSKKIVVVPPGPTRVEEYTYYFSNKRGEVRSNRYLYELPSRKFFRSELFSIEPQCLRVVNPTEVGSLGEDEGVDAEGGKP